MADAVSIIIAITGLIVTIYMCMKSIKSVNTPCFKISVDGDLQDASLLKFVSHHITPRKVKVEIGNAGGISVPESLTKDIEAATQVIDNEINDFGATSSTKKNDQ